MFLKQSIQLGLCGLLFVLAGARAFAEFDGDVRSWQTLSANLYEDADWRATLTGQTRLFDDSKFLGAWLLIPTLQYKVHPNYDLGASYLLEDYRAAAGEDYTRLHIFWLHLSPHWQVSENLNFSMRHVLGYRAVESAENYWLSRHRFALSYKLGDLGPLVGIGASTELFYNYEEDFLCENRFIPLSLSFKLNETSKLSLYMMAQSRRSAGDSNWNTAYVFGQSLSIKF